MLPVKHILFPVDFSERSLAAAPFVEAIAKRYNAKVTMLTVVQPIAYTGMAEPGAAFFIDPEELRSNAQGRLDGTLTKQFAGIPVTRIAEIGDPALSITGFANAHAADMIMMPTHGYGMFRRLLLGSVTAKVLHDAQVPVWTEAHMEEPLVQEHLSAKTILCAVDNTEKSGPLMQWAAQYAKDGGGSLRLVHAIPGVEAWPDRQMDREFEEAIRARSQEEIGKIQKAAGVNAPLCIGVGDVAGAVREEARRHNADLIVIGRGVVHETLGRLRTHAYGIIRHSPCPVISV